MEKEKKQDKNQVVVIKTDHSGKENENVEYMAIPENDTPGGAAGSLKPFSKKERGCFSSWLVGFLNLSLISLLK